MNDKKTTQHSNLKKANKIVNDWLLLNDPRKKIDLACMELHELPPIPSTCQILYCHNNELTFLPELPNCRILYCYNNQLTSLPSLPNCTILSCISNKLTSLPELPKCVELYCHNNKLTYLPELPKCRTLYCNNNQLTGIPNLPKCDLLSCHTNQLTALPFLPDLSKINFIRCHNNKYIYITKFQAKILRIKETPNYKKYATIIQRNYRNHLRDKYYEIISQYLFKGPAKLVTLFIT